MVNERQRFIRLEKICQSRKQDECISLKDHDKLSFERQSKRQYLTDAYVCLLIGLLIVLLKIRI